MRVRIPQIFLIASSLLVIVLLIFAIEGATYQYWIVVPSIIIVFIVSLMVSIYYNKGKLFWFSVDFTALLTGMIAIFIAIANAQKADHAAEVRTLVDSAKLNYIHTLYVAGEIFNECHPPGMQLPSPRNPKNNCERLYGFMLQIRNEFDNPVNVDFGEGIRWDLNLCSDIALSTGSKSWPNLCSQLTKLAKSQEKLRAKITDAPVNAFITLSQGRSAYYWALFAAMLFATKLAKFAYEFNEKEVDWS